LLSLLLAIPLGCDPPVWRPVLATHAERYPAWQLPDAYKLLHQATLGSEHAIADREAPRAWLARELGALGEGPDEPVADTLGRFVRIHLRPFVARGGDTTALLDAFIRTANTPTDTTDLACALRALEAMADEGVLPWTADAVREYVSGRRAAGFPAVHHSDAFRAAYAPAYRVVGRGMVGGLSVKGET
jgi:hypothetical protein